MTWNLIFPHPQFSEHKSWSTTVFPEGADNLKAIMYDSFHSSNHPPELDISTELWQNIPRKNIWYPPPGRISSQNVVWLCKLASSSVSQILSRNEILRKVNGNGFLQATQLHYLIHKKTEGLASSHFPLVLIKCFDLPCIRISAKPQTIKE